MPESFLLNLILIAVASALTAAALVPVASYLAIWVGLVDKPDAKRKLHERPIPLVGGIVIFLATTIVALIAISQFGSILHPSGIAIQFVREHVGLLLASLVLLTVGVLDDRFKIRGRHKLLGQILAATILIGFGYYFDQVKISNWVVPFGVFSVLIVYFWLLGAVNSVNLLDGADGFAGTLGLVVSLAITTMALFGGQARSTDAVISASMAGALIGFLAFNLPPARIYLGDAGSMLIGQTLGALAISTALKEQMFYALVAPLAILSIPIMDSTVAIVRRKMTGRGIYAVDRGHIHHNLLSQGLSPKMAVLWMFVLCGTTAIGGVLSFATRESEFAVISVLLVVGFLIAGRIFGFAEFKMVGSKVKGVTMRMMPMRPRTMDPHHCEEYQLQGTRDWGRLFAVVRQFAMDHGYIKVTLDINAPWIHESYHGTWKSPTRTLVEAEEWESSLPLILEDRIYGRIEIIASGDECNAYQSIPGLIQLLSTTGTDLLRSQTLPAIPTLAKTPAQTPTPVRKKSGKSDRRMEDSGVLSR